MGEGVVDARQLWSKLRQRKPYKPQLEESLKLHAEKKALAMLLSNNVEDELSISINFNACMDCHEFFKISSQMLGRRIQLHQPQMTHTFSAGNCSCNDQWSWEARLTPAMRIIAAAKPEGDVPNPQTNLASVSKGEERAPLNSSGAKPQREGRNCGGRNRNRGNTQRYDLW